jgi:hypothetical protein
MSTHQRVCGILTIGVLAFAGCKKAPPPPTEAVQIGDSRLDLPKLQFEFKNASPELKQAISRINFDYRAARLTQMLAELERLAGNPGLTESQRKLVMTVVELTKQGIADREAANRGQ